MKASIVIPIWNGSDAIKRNLPKIIEVARSSGIEEIILSDDASPDGSVGVIKTQFPEVTLVERQTNAGFASNVNTGVGHVKSELIVLLNIDALPKQGFLESALSHFKDPKVFSVGCNVGGVWSKGYFKDGFFWHSQADLEKVDNNKPHQTLWASGGSGIFRKSIWDELGGLDPLYNPFYEEDVDLGYRATKRGYINIWEPASKVEHYKEVGAIASNFPQKAISSVAERNHLIFIWKNITSPKLTAQHQEALVKMLIQHPRYWKTFLSALQYWPEIAKRRKIEKLEAKLTDEEIFSLFSNN